MKMILRTLLVLGLLTLSANSYQAENEIDDITPQAKPKKTNKEIIRPDAQGGHDAYDYINLTDENFEHQTQATTGSTTGDWLILFCDDSKHIGLCHELLPIWHELYGELYGRVNVAYVDV